MTEPGGSCRRTWALYSLHGSQSVRESGEYHAKSEGRRESRLGDAEALEHLRLHRPKLACSAEFAKRAGVATMTTVGGAIVRSCSFKRCCSFSMAVGS